MSDIVSGMYGNLRRADTDDEVAAAIAVRLQIECPSFEGLDVLHNGRLVAVKCSISGGIYS